jgi:hypothetical protein
MLDLMIDSILKLQPHEGFGDFSEKAFAGRFGRLQGPHQLLMKCREFVEHFLQQFAGCCVMQGERFCFVGDDGKRDSLLSSTSRFNLTIEPDHSGFPGDRIDLGQSLSSSIEDLVHALPALNSTLRELHRAGSLSGHSREPRADTQHRILNVSGHLLQLSGDPGLGKSFITLDIAARVSRGKRWPDNPQSKQPAGKVILPNCEDDPGDTIAPRLDKANADDTKIIVLKGVSLMSKRRPFSLECDIPRLEEALTDHRDVRLIVIDPIAGFLGKVDSHNNSEVRGMLAPLADLASRFHVAILTVTHLAKTGGNKAFYRAMGSLAFAAAARAVRAITKNPDNPERRLFLPAKLNPARDPDGLAYRNDDGRVVWEFNPVKMHADDAFAAETANQLPPSVAANDEKRSPGCVNTSATKHCQRIK